MPKDSPLKTEDNGKDEKGRFKKGHHKPGPGRPAIYRDAQKACKEFMEKEGWDLAFKLAREKGRSQLPAIEFIAAYGFGKPPQEIKLGGSGEVRLRVVYGDIAGTGNNNPAPPPNPKATGDHPSPGKAKDSAGRKAGGKDCGGCDSGR